MEISKKYYGLAYGKYYIYGHAVKCFVYEQTQTNLRCIIYLGLANMVLRYYNMEDVTNICTAMSNVIKNSYTYKKIIRVIEFL